MTLIEQAKQVEQRLREYRNYKAICTQAVDTIATLIAEVAQAEQRGAEAMREKCKLACLRVGSVREVLNEIKGMK